MKSLYKAAYIAGIIFTFFVSPAVAQTSISLMRYDDNFSSLKNDTFKRGFNHLKAIKLSSQSYLSVGGELREQFQVYNNTNFGDVPPNFPNVSAAQLWHRFLLHANIELGTHFRLFIQANNTLRFLNDNPLVAEIDQNQLNLHQAFAEVKFNDWRLRLGRQELFYGNHRLLTVREGPNTRQAFDGLVIKRKFKNGSIDLLAISKVISNPKVFDDQSLKEGLFGFYGTQYFLRQKVGLDYYMIHFISNLRRYSYQPGKEKRQTYGTRIFSRFNTVNFEIEAAYQSGTFAKQIISAYSVLADVNLLLFPKKNGVIGLVANVASGDANPSDGKLNTYNFMYAKPAYGLAIPIGATNVVSVNPYFKFNLTPKLNVLAQVFFISRKSNTDGTYSPGMIQNRPKPESVFSTDKKTLGQFYVLESSYQQNRNLSFSFDVSYFKAGDYPEATRKGKNTAYVSFKTTLRF